MDPKTLNDKTTNSYMESWDDAVIIKLSPEDESVLRLMDAFNGESGNKVYQIEQEHRSDGKVSVSIDLVNYNRFEIWLGTIASRANHAISLVNSLPVNEHTCVIPGNYRNGTIEKKRPRYGEKPADQVRVQKKQRVAPIEPLEGTLKIRITNDACFLEEKPRRRPRGGVRARERMLRKAERANRLR